MDTTLRDEGREFSGYVGREVKAEAARQSISATALAKAIGIERISLYRYFAGKRALPLDTLYAVAEALDCDPGWLVTTAYERFMKDNPDIDYREHGIKNLPNQTQ